MKSQADINDYLRTLKIKRRLVGYDPECVFLAFGELDSLYRAYHENELAQAVGTIARYERETQETAQTIAALSKELEALRERNKILEKRNRLLEGQMNQLTDGKHLFGKRIEELPSIEGAPMAAATVSAAHGTGDGHTGRGISAASTARAVAVEYVAETEHATTPTKRPAPKKTKPGAGKKKEKQRGKKHAKPGAQSREVG